ncbi:MAG: DUF2946 family protein [Pseudomonadota bacterium]
MMRSVISAVMAVLLLVTSLSAASARGANPAAQSMVICSGHGVALIYLDADGNETRAPHLCPDCLMHLTGLPGAPVVLALVAGDGGAVVLPAPVAQVHVTQRLHRSARAPPETV